MVVADLPDMAGAMRKGGPASIALVSASISGVFLALGASLQIKPEGFGSAVVVINDQPIERAEYERALAAVAADKRNPLSDEDRQRILARLIEEELLIQRGVEIGLVDRDRNVRGAVVAAVIEHILVASQSDPVAEDDLRRWYDENADRFRPQPQVHLREVSEPHGANLPDGLVPASTLRDYVGPNAVARALESKSGSVFSDNAGRSYEVIARAAPPPPPFEMIQTDIEAAFRRDAGDKAFRDYLDWLENRAEIKRRDP